MRFLAKQGDRWRQTPNLDRETARAMALGPTPVWVRAGGMPAADWDLLASWFDLHPLALEDVRNLRQRPKVEDYPGITFVVLRLPRLDRTEEGDFSIRWDQVGVFLGEGFVLTASAANLAELDALEQRITGEGPPHPATPADVFYHILDAVVDSYFPFVDHLEDELEELEDSVLDRAGRAELHTIRNFKKIVSQTRKVVPPMREAIQRVERRDYPNVPEALRVYLRDVSDHMVRISERLEHIKEVTLIAQETWNSTLANQQNQVMKRLTVVAALLLVPGLLAGLGGMNFPGLPEWPFWVVASTLIGGASMGLLISWRRGWM